MRDSIPHSQGDQTGLKQARIVGRYRVDQDAVVHDTSQGVGMRECGADTQCSMGLVLVVELDEMWMDFDKGLVLTVSVRVLSRHHAEEEEHREQEERESSLHAHSLVRFVSATDYSAYLSHSLLWVPSSHSRVPSLASPNIFTEVFGPRVRKSSTTRAHTLRGAAIPDGSLADSLKNLPKEGPRQAGCVAGLSIVDGCNPFVTLLVTLRKD